MNNDMPSKSEKKGATPKGEGSRDPQYGKGESTVKQPPTNKKEFPSDAPGGMSAKGSKDNGPAVTGGSDRSSKSPNSEKPKDAPNGMNQEFEVPHTHLPALAAAKKGDEVHLHVFGKVKSHDGTMGKNSSTKLIIHSVKPHGEESNAPATPTNAASAPLDHLKQAIKGSSPEFYSKD